MTMSQHDQTRGETNPHFPDDQPAPLSCTETATLCMKAARGAGMSWGMAEEAGFAAAWLVSHGVDGPTHLRAHLDRADGLGWSELCPAISPDQWRNAEGLATCPIILGATLSDYADLPEGPAPGRSIDLGLVSAPILLVPFLAGIAHQNGLAITLSWNGSSICIDEEQAWLSKVVETLVDPHAELTLTARSAHPHRPCPATTPNARTTAATIAALTAYAMRTTVPATEASRAGAGSTLSDND